MEAWKEELYHFGIPDMRWGFRRFQNKDGTRTAAGKERYRKRKDGDNTSDEKRDATPGNKTEGESATASYKSETASYKHNDYKHLSDKELKARTQRMNLEKEYKKLVPEEMSMGKKFVENYLKPTVSDYAKNAGKKLLSATLDPYVDRYAKSIKTAIEANMKKQKED